MGEHIILHSTGCYYCKKTKAMLDEHHVSYEEQTDQKIMIDKGFREVPVIEIGNKIIEGWTAVSTWLEDNNYYSNV